MDRGMDGRAWKCRSGEQKTEKNWNLRMSTD